MIISYPYLINNLTFFISFINLLVSLLFFPFTDQFYLLYVFLVLIHFTSNLLIKNNFLFCITSFLNLLIFYFGTIYQDSLNLLLWQKGSFLTDDALVYFTGIENADFAFGQSGVIWSSLILFIQSLDPSLESKNIVFLNYVLIFLIMIFISNILENLFKYYLFHVPQKTILSIQRFYIYILTGSPYIIYYSLFALKEIWIIFLLSFFSMCLINAINFFNDKKILSFLLSGSLGLLGLIFCLIDKQSILIMLLIILFSLPLLIFLEKNRITLKKKLKKYFIYILLICFILFNFEIIFSFSSSYINQFLIANSNNLILFIKGIFTPLPISFLNNSDGLLNSVDSVLIGTTPFNLTILTIFGLFFIKHFLKNSKKFLVAFNRYNFIIKSIFLYPIVGLFFYSFIYSSVYRYKISFYFFLPFCLLILFDLQLNLRYKKLSVENKLK